jgi:hypothetical protein
VCLGRNRENRTGRVSCCVLLAKYYWGDQFKKDEMGGTCGRHGREEKHIQNFGGTAWKTTMVG